MESFWIAFNGVLPLFAMIALGAFVRYRKFLTDTEFAHLNRMVFQVFFFVMLLHSTYTADMGKVLTVRMVAFSVGALLLLYALTWVVVCALDKDTRHRGAMIQAIYRSNVVILGYPLVANLFGEDQVGLVAGIMVIIVPLYNTLAVTTLEYFRPGGGGGVAWGAVLKGLLKNPMLRGTMAGAVLLLLGVDLPIVIMRPLKQIAGMCSPLALLVLGASFNLRSVAQHAWQLGFVVLSRLVLAPAAVMAVAVWMGFRDLELITLLVVFATPTAVASFTMAQQLGGNALLAGDIVVFTSALASVTLFGWSLLLKLLHLI